MRSYFEWCHTSQIAILMIVNCQTGKPQPPVAARSLGMKDVLYFRFLPCRAWFPNSAHSNTAVTAWFISGRLATVALGWVLAAYLNHRQLNVIVPYCANKTTCWAFEQKGRGFWSWRMEKLAIRNQKNLKIKNPPTYGILWIPVATSPISMSELFKQFGKINYHQYIQL